MEPWKCFKVFSSCLETLKLRTPVNQRRYILEKVRSNHRIMEVFYGFAKLSWDPKTTNPRQYSIVFLCTKTIESFLKVFPNCLEALNYKPRSIQRRYLLDKVRLNHRIMKVFKVFSSCLETRKLQIHVNPASLSSRQRQIESSKGLLA